MDCWFSCVKNILLKNFQPLSFASCSFTGKCWEFWFYNHIWIRLQKSYKSNNDQNTLSQFKRGKKKIGAQVLKNWTKRIFSGIFQTPKYCFAKETATELSYSITNMLQNLFSRAQHPYKIMYCILHIKAIALETWDHLDAQRYWFTDTVLQN